MSNVSIKPSHGRVLVRALDNPERKVGNIYLSDGAAQDTNVQRGVIVAVGDGRWNQRHFQHEPMDYKVGDHVLFTQYAGAAFFVGADRYRIIADDDLLGTYDPAMDDEPKPEVQTAPEAPDDDEDKKTEE